MKVENEEFEVQNNQQCESGMRTFTYQTRTFLLGTSAVDNWALLATADRKDWWVHLAHSPSAHVILQDSLPPSEDELVFAKNLILQQTKKAATSASLVYTQVCNVKRGAVPGEVIIKKEKYF